MLWTRRKGLLGGE